MFKTMPGLRKRNTDHQPWCSQMVQGSGGCTSSAQGPPSTKGWLPGKNVGPASPTRWIFKRMLKYGSLQERSQFFKCYAFFFFQSHTGELSWWPSGLDSKLQSLVGKLRSHMLCSMTKKFLKNGKKKRS